MLFLLAISNIGLKYTLAFYKQPVFDSVLLFSIATGTYMQQFIDNKEAQ